MFYSSGLYFPFYFKGLLVYRQLIGPDRQLIGPDRQLIGPDKQLICYLTGNHIDVIKVAMGKTLEVASERSYDDTRTILPVEVARGVIIRNVPTLQGLKLMHLLIATAGGRMANDSCHELRLADIRNIDGMRHHDRASIQTLFEDLSAMVLTYDNPQNMVTKIGGFVEHSEINYRNENNGEVIVSWYFGRIFKEMAAQSNHWTILDRQTVFHLGSKYSVLMFQHISSYVPYEYVKSKSFTVPELRALLGVTEGKLGRFSNLMQKAIQPAIEEINQLSRFTLTAKPNKVGRSVETVTISWKVKPDPTPVKRELNSASIGRKSRRDGTAEAIVEPFPDSGTIHFTRWEKIAREHLPSPIPDLGMVTEAFRNFAQHRGFSLESSSVEKAFIGFCKKYQKRN